MYDISSLYLILFIQ